MTKDYQYKETKTTTFVKKILKLVCLCGAPNFWFQDLDISPFLRKFLEHYHKFLHVFVIITIILQIGAFGTQHELSDKQQSDLPLFCGSFILFYIFVSSLAYYRNLLRVVMFKIMVEMKELHNDSEVEDAFIKQCLFFLKLHGTMWVGVSSFLGLDVLMKMVLEGETFTTLVMAWPDVHDHSRIAGVSRAFIFFAFVVQMTWFSTAYTLSIPVTVGLSHQYTNLGKYFESLNGIFEGEGDLQQKEVEFEKAIKIGIKCHVELLWCVTSIQSIFSILNGGQLFQTTMALIMLMYQYTQMERTVTLVIYVLVTATSVLLTTGVLMWKAGDVTFEAAGLPTAIFCSGWQNCSKQASRRVRPLIVIAMAVAQIPVELKALGLVSFSYDSYVSIVKSSYTVFSVIY